MADVVVTGGQGFLGSHLVYDLVLRHQETVATYNYTPPANPERTKYLSHFRIDVTDFAQCSKLIMQENPYVLYHLVAQPIVTAAIRNPLSTMELTTRGTWNMLEAVRLYGSNIKAIVFVSSDKVYGNNTEATELSPLSGTDHPYNVAKVAADVVAQSYASSYGLPVVISRSANLYGPGDFHWDRVVPGISRDLFYGRRPVLRSNGEQLRDYIHVSDGVRALTAMADAMENGRFEKGFVFNFGSEKTYSVRQVVQMLMEAADRPDLLPIIMGGAKDEITEQHIDFSRAYTVLGWRPIVPMLEGIHRTYAWYKTWFEK